MISRIKRNLNVSFSSLAKDKEDGDSQLKTVIKERDSYIWELNKSKQSTEELFIPQIKEVLLLKTLCNLCYN